MSLQCKYNTEPLSIKENESYFFKKQEFEFVKGLKSYWFLFLMWVIVHSLLFKLVSASKAGYVLARQK